MMNPVVPTQPALPLVANHLDQVCNEAVNRSSTVSESSATGAQAASRKSAFAKAVKNIALPMAIAGAAMYCTGSFLLFVMPPIGIPMMVLGGILAFVGTTRFSAERLKKKRQNVGGPNDRLVEKPRSPKTVINKAINQAFDSLPNRIQLEMSKLPRITPELARRYNTTVAQLQTDQVQAIKTVSLHTVLDQLKSATDEHWDRHSRQAQKSEINSYAQSAILDKLARLQTEQGLNALVAQAAKGKVEPQSIYGLSQREFFALNRISESMIRKCLYQAISLPTAQSCSLSREDIERAQIQGDNTMAKVIESLYMAFDKFVRPNDAEPDMTQVRRLLGDTSNDPVATQWLQDQQSSFNQQINDAFQPFGENAGIAAQTILAAHLQQAGNLRTAFVQDRSAFAGARQKLEQVRQEVSKREAVGTSDLKDWLQIGLQGIREMIEDPHSEFADLREAQDDNRAGTPWKDGRLHQHMNNMLNPRMLAQVGPHQRAAVLDALAAYGEKAVKLLNESGVSIRTSSEEYVPPEPPPEPPRDEENGSAGPAACVKEKKIYDSPYPRIDHGKLPVTFNTNSHYCVETRNIKLDENHTEVLRNVAVHELGHALDAAIAKQIEYPVLFTDRHINLKTEYDNAKKDNTMITTYAQTDHREMFAESASAYMGVGYGHDSTFAKPVGSIKSRENLQARHPVTAQFLDEVLRAPTKAVRAANTPLTVDADRADNGDPADNV